MINNSLKVLIKFVKEKVKSLNSYNPNKTLKL